MWKTSLFRVDRHVASILWLGNFYLSICLLVSQFCPNLFGDFSVSCLFQPLVSDEPIINLVRFSLSAIGE